VYTPAMLATTNQPIQSNIKISQLQQKFFINKSKFKNKKRQERDNLPLT